MQLLYDLGQYFRNYKQNNQFCFVKLPKNLPNSSNAKWNSRAIFAFLTYILVHEQRVSLVETCAFISGCWLDLCFTSHMCDPQAYNNLCKAVEFCPKALRTTRSFWCEDHSPIDTERSNRCAERAVKLMQELRSLTIVNKNSEFVLQNNY